MKKALGLRAVVAGLLFAMLITTFAVLPDRTAQAAAKDHTSFGVFFPLYTKVAASVFPVRYLVPITSTPMKAALEALIAGIPGTGASFIPLPKDAEVLGISVNAGVCTVDFSAEILQVNVGSGGEAAVLSSIVATLGQFPDVNAVRILVEGQPMETLAGHVDITGPLSDSNIPVFQVMDDVSQHWSGGAVGVLMVKDVLDGYPDGAYKPDKEVTRAEFIKMLVEGLGLPYDSGEAVPFKDVTGQWHEDYIRRALASGLVKASDYGDNLKPDEVISREEMAGLLVTASAAYLKDHPEVDYAEVSPAPVFGDLAAASEKYRASVQESARLGFLVGFPDGTFRPKDGLTRGEAATVVTRVLGMSGSDDIIRLSPLQGAKWDGGSVTVLGAASAFEANVNWRIAGPSGDIMYDYTTATMGMGWGLFGLHVDAALFADKSPTALELFLVSMKDGSEYSGVSLPLVK